MSKRQTWQNREEAEEPLNGAWKRPCRCGTVEAVQLKIGKSRVRYYRIICEACGRETPKCASPGLAMVAWNKGMIIEPENKPESDTETQAEEQ